MTITINSGPWGHVKSRVMRSASGDHEVHVWVNGCPQMPTYGLDRSEALAHAREVVDNYSAQMQADFESRLTEEQARALPGLHIGLNDDNELRYALQTVNSFHGWTLEQRITEFRADFIRRRNAYTLV